MQPMRDDGKEREDGDPEDTKRERAASPGPKKDAGDE